MMNILKYIIAVISVLAAIVSCSMQELDEGSREKEDSVEFIVRPTSFTGYNPLRRATKALSTEELTEVERRVASAFFLVFDANGDRVIFENLTVSNNIIPTQKILTDFGGDNNVTVCYLANVTEEYASGLTTLDALSTEPLQLTYSRYADAGYIGIPNVDVSGTPEDPSDDVMCFPMFGMTSCSLHNLEGNKVVIDLKRLFAKISVNINLDLKKGGEVEVREAYLELTRYAVKNLPTKIKLTESKTVVEDQVVLDESDWVSDEDSFVPETSAAISAVLGNDTNPTNGYNIQFYVPEYILLPAPDKVGAAKDLPPAEQERMKPLLIADDTFPLSLEIKGMFYTVQGDDIQMTYNIFLGENSFDSFSHFRNILYVNNMTIRGAAIVDNRVEMKYAGFRVGFPHSVQMDAHFNVRPLRLQFTDEFTEGLEAGVYSHGEIKIEVIKSKDTGRDPKSWIALERPIESEIKEGNTKYSKGYTINDKKAPYPTKRRYFTTGLISELETQQKNSADDPSAGATVTFRTDEANALDVSIITWVYVDEYSTQSADPENTFRQDTLAVTFTMDGSSEGVTKKYLVRQSPIYPINVSNTRTYGIELFEEYTMNYDSDEHYDSEENLGFHTNVNGIAWGLDSIFLSRNKLAIYLPERDPAKNPYVSPGTSPYLKNYFGSEFGIPGIITIDLMEEIIGSGIFDRLDEEVKDLDSYYDYYTEADKSYVSNLSSQKIRDFDGFAMNVEIIHTLLQYFSNNPKAKLNKMVLDENPLSVIAYCYNKNKRNADGEVVRFLDDGKTMLDITNYHWYAPAIEEIEEIMSTSYNNGNWLNENFKSFGDNLYWSCQPSYLNNDIKLDYEAKVHWTINGEERKLVWEGYRPTWKTEYSQEILTGSIIAYADGNYLKDDVKRARATRYDTENGRTIGSYSAHVSQKLEIVSNFPSETFSHETSVNANATTVAQNITEMQYWGKTGEFFRKFREYINGVDLSKSGEKDTGKTPDRGEGNSLRTDVKRVRCVYYDHSYKKATRSVDETIITNEKNGYKTEFSTRY